MDLGPKSNFYKTTLSITDSLCPFQKIKYSLMNPDENFLISSNEFDYSMYPVNNSIISFNVDYSKLSSYLSDLGDKSENRYKIIVEITENRSYRGNPIIYKFTKDVYLHADFTDFSEKRQNFNEIWLVVSVIIAALLAVDVVKISKIFILKKGK